MQKIKMTGLLSAIILSLAAISCGSNQTSEVSDNRIATETDDLNFTSRNHRRADEAVLPGIEVLRKSGFSALKGKRVGLITNPTGIDNTM
ncbi:MAG: hypothetical protein K2H57_00920, partial [Duncaniella sp.]|nr:hypothetical protein [Duncaniella sp.]